MPSLSDYQTIINQFNNIFRLPPELETDTDESGVTLIKITFYLRSGFYGETKIRVREWYDQSNLKFRYRYSWEKNRTKPGHISAWENEPHNIPHGLETDPHHHHHVPGDRSKVQGNFDTRDLEKALLVVEEYILENKEYDGKLV